MTDGVLVDTDVFSFLIKGDSRGRLYAAAIKGKLPCLSFMSVAEAKRWALSRGWGTAKLQILKRGLAQYTTIPYDEPLADAWAEIANHRSRIGRRIEVGDCWIAATAVRHGLPLITHNAVDYSDIRGLSIISHAT